MAQVWHPPSLGGALPLSRHTAGSTLGWSLPALSWRQPAPTPSCRPDNLLNANHRPLAGVLKWCEGLRLARARRPAGRTRLSDLLRHPRALCSRNPSNPRRHMAPDNTFVPNDRRTRRAGAKRVGLSTATALAECRLGDLQERLAPRESRRRPLKP